MIEPSHGDKTCIRKTDEFDTTVTIQTRIRKNDEFDTRVTIQPR